MDAQELRSWIVNSLEQACEKRAIAISEFKFHKRSIDYDDATELLGVIGA